MDKLFKSPMFIIGVPLVICGFGIGLNDLLRGAGFSRVALGLLISGFAFLAIGWMRRKG